MCLQKLCSSVKREKKYHFGMPLFWPWKETFQCACAQLLKLHAINSWDENVQEKFHFFLKKG